MKKNENSGSDDAVPSNILYFPGMLSRKIGSPAPTPQTKAVNVLRFPERPMPDHNETHDLLEETQEILARCSGVSSLWQSLGRTFPNRPVLGELPR